ncbi:MAG TPA: right-handed parallel beta-helix repeat-containing protein [Candidatus Acidoferrum sp.]|jgi:hypothetical protein|nr:right-handed parallel beta-helix repeat-containing protein [Candidatus Acidoferrum sp.]
MKAPLCLLRNLQNWPVGIVLLLLLCAAPSQAATVTVTSLADSGSGSLRAAIAGANPGDYITFSGPLAGQTIHLTTGQLTVGKNLTIDASGFSQPVAIDAGGSSRVFEITAGIVSLAGLTLTNGVCPAGTAGGGIQVDPGAALTVNSLTISGCIATNGSAGGGIYVYGTANLTVVFSTISGCIATNGSAGGGIYNSGTATLEYCTLTGNISGTGGGIYAMGATTLNDCTLVGNYAQTNVSGEGGGIYNYGTHTFTLNNCTLSGNSAYLGGGIYNPTAGLLILTNTIVAGNTASFAGPDIASFYTGANNFIGGDPKLAPLGNYGGPTQTMQPLSGSPVIDAGTDSVTNFLTYDQRVSLRLSGAHVDIGAVEKQFSAPAAQPLVLKNVRRLNNQFQFAFTNAPNVDFTALSSTNLALPLTNWAALGNVTEISSGQYQFTDTSATNHAQFYRVVSP